MIKPYQQIPILECGEPLVPIPLGVFAVEDPHPYVKIAAPYGSKSPYYLRRGVLAQLIEAQQLLQQQCPGWQIQIFDAYRPIAVQQYMVDYTFHQTAFDQGLQPERLTDLERQAILEQVYQFWAVPSANPAMPPPHSTGAAVDITLVDATGVVVDMGSPIDEMSPRSYPDYFADELQGVEKFDRPASEAERSKFHHNRQLLRQVMVTAGFRQHPREWWHFSLGDQVWAWLLDQEEPNVRHNARYGSI